MKTYRVESKRGEIVQVHMYQATDMQALRAGIEGGLLKPYEERTEIKPIQETGQVQVYEVRHANSPSLSSN